jgi:hypothetical protein
MKTLKLEGDAQTGPRLVELKLEREIDGFGGAEVDLIVELRAQNQGYEP